MSFWKRAHGPIDCLAVGCETVVQDGGIYYQNRYGLDYCEPCGRRLFQTIPSALVEDVPSEKLKLPPSLEKFNRPAMVKEINKRMRDFRKRQAGDTA